MTRPPEAARVRPVSVPASAENAVCRLIRGLAGLPETNVLAFGFLLHLPWELWLFGSGSVMDSHVRDSGELPLALSLAALAHAAINLLAFWFIAAGVRTRSWIRSAGVDTLGVFVLSSVMFTLMAESLANGVFVEAEHLGALPSFVAPGQGVPSLLQSVVAPVLIVGILRRQLPRVREASS